MEKASDKFREFNVGVVSQRNSGFSHRFGIRYHDFRQPPYLPDIDKKAEKNGRLCKKAIRKKASNNDLVQEKPGPIGPLLDAIRGRLDSWLGRPRCISAGRHATLFDFHTVLERFPELDLGKVIAGFKSVMARENRSVSWEEFPGNMESKLSHRLIIADVPPMLMEGDFQPVNIWQRLSPRLQSTW